MFAMLCHIEHTKSFMSNDFNQLIWIFIFFSSFQQQINMKTYLHFYKLMFKISRNEEQKNNISFLVYWSDDNK